MNPSPASLALLAVAALPLVPSPALAVPPPVTPPPGSVWENSVVSTLRFSIGGGTTPPTGTTPVDRQHTDVLVAYGGGAGGIDIRFGHGNSQTQGGTTLPSASVALVGNANTGNPIDEVPPGFEFIGATPGSTVWILEEGFIGNSLYLGLNSAGVELARLVAWNPGEPEKNAGFTGKFIQISLLAVRGPGHFSLFQDGDEPDQPRVFMSSFRDGVDAQDRAFHFAGGHEHFNWAFTAAGNYEVDWQTSTFVVVPEPSSAALLVAGVLGVVARRRRVVRL